MFGGTGIDTVSYVGTTSGVVARLDGGINWGAATGDVISEVENLIGSNHDDQLIGSAGANLLEGGDGDDTLYGEAGDDTLIGGAGADTMYAGTGIDSVSYAGATSGVVARLDGGINWGAATGDVISEVENLVGSTHDDQLIGSAGANLLESGDGDDILYGEAGDDTLIGGEGADTIYGGTGIDTVSYAGATSGVVARLDGGINWGAATGDVISEVENLIGSAFDDYLIGSADANQLEGGSGNDTLEGGVGVDSLLGGYGDDTYLVSLDHTDLFSHNAYQQTDIIADADGEDHIDFSGMSVAIFVDATTGLVQMDTDNAENIFDGLQHRHQIAQISGVEHITGTAFHDHLIGEGSGNRLDGGAGHDSLEGNAGNDTPSGARATIR